MHTLLVGALGALLVSLGIAGSRLVADSKGTSVPLALTAGMASFVVWLSIFAGSVGLGRAIVISLTMTTLIALGVGSRSAPVPDAESGTSEPDAGGRGGRREPPSFKIAEGSGGPDATPRNGQGTPAGPDETGHGWDSLTTLMVCLWLPLVTLIALRGYFYDEFDHHLPLTTQILRDCYPPAYPFLPQAPFRYHFGFDLLAAATARVGGLSPWMAFDVLTFLCAGALVTLTARIAGHQGVASGGAAAVLVGLGGGLAWLAFVADVRALPSVGGPSSFSLPFYRLEYQPWQVPPIVGYLFQHPMALGMPLYLGFALALEEALAKVSAAHRVSAVLLLAALGLSQQALFWLCFPLTMARASLVALWNPKEMRPGVATSGAILAFGAALWWVASGPSSPDPTQGLTSRWPPHLGWTTPPTGPAPRGWLEVPFPGYLSAFGLPYILGLLGLVRAWRRRWALGVALGAAGFVGFALPHVVELRQSPWDTSKFLVGSALAAAILGGSLIGGLVDSVPAGSARRRGRRFLLLTLVMACPSPLLFLGVRLLGPLGIAEDRRPIPLEAFPPPAGLKDLAASIWLGQHASPRDVALTIGPHVAGLSGVPTLAPQDHLWAWSRSTDPEGVHRSAIAELWSGLEPRLLKLYDIRWLVLGPQERGRLGVTARARLSDPSHFAREFRDGDGADRREVWRVLP